MARLVIFANFIFLLQVHNTAAAENITDPVCPEGWRRIAQWCLQPSSTEKSWPEAVSACTTLHSHLVTIEYSQFNDAVHDLFGSDNDIWIGLVNLEWVDGSPYSSYNEFTGEAPILGDYKECTVMLSSSKAWNEVYCSETYHYVCQKQAALANMAYGHSGLHSSSAGSNFRAPNAVDGDKDATPDSMTCAKTEVEAEPWWFVDLEDQYTVFSIVITTLQDCCGEAEYLEVKVGNASSAEGMTSCGFYFQYAASSTLIAECSQPVSARYVRIEAASSVPHPAQLGLCEVEVFVDVPALLDCPPDYVEYTEDPGHCFTYRTDEKPWNLARVSCQQEGGDLAKLDSPHLNEFFQYVVRPNEVDLSHTCFIGLTDKTEENIFRWVDGTLSTNVHWSLDEPNNANNGEDCVEVYATGLWNDIPCLELRNYACEIVVNKTTRPNDDADITLPPIIDCSDNEYTCDTGSCIPDSYYCDEINDCPDGSDEFYCDLTYDQCTDNNFPCNSGSCISPAFLCDGYSHCWDGSDEANCNSRVLYRGCPNYWVALDNYCYYFSEFREETGFALSSCSWQGGSLVTVNSYSINKFISADTLKGSKTPYWLGLNKVYVGSGGASTPEPFFWQHDLSYLTDDKYSNWAAGQPDPKFDCVVIVKSLWYTANCSDVNYYICEKEREPWYQNVYFHLSPTYSWHGAFSACEENGKRLTRVKDSVTNQEMANFLQTQEIENDFWIDSQKNSTSAEWHYGFSTEKVTYADFSDNFTVPSNDFFEDECAYLWKEGGFQWAYGSCDEYIFKGYVCEDDPPYVESACPEGWRVFDHKCYGFTFGLLTWNEAEAECQKYRGSLAKFDSAKILDNVFLKYFHAYESSALIGLHSPVIDGVFVWIDGTPLEYSNWGEGEPNDYLGVEKCVEIQPDGKFNDISCSLRLNFICEKPLYGLMPNYYWDLSGGCNKSDVSEYDCESDYACNIYSTEGGQGASFNRMPKLEPFFKGPQRCAITAADGNTGYFGDYSQNCVADLSMCEDGITLTVWLKIPSETNSRGMYFVSSHAETEFGSLTFAIMSSPPDGGSMQRLYCVFNVETYTSTISSEFPPDEWFHLTCAHFPKINSFIYINGAPPSDTMTPPPTSYPGSFLGGLVIGDVDAPSSFSIAVLKIFFKVLSEKEVSGYYEFESGPSDACANFMIPCLNGATCSSVDAWSFSCLCLPGFTGPYCEIGFYQCDAIYCDNGGTCVEDPEGAYCSCLAQWYGSTCQWKVDEIKPTTCREVRLAGASVDQEYTLYFHDTPVRIYCHQMNTDTPKEYLSLPGDYLYHETYSEHYVETVDTSYDLPSTITTIYDKIRLDPDTLKVHTGDYTFMRTKGYDSKVCQAGGCIQDTAFVPLGVASDCNGVGSMMGGAVLDLRGTAFAILNSFAEGGRSATTSSTTYYDSYHQYMELQAGGDCGWVSPSEVAWSEERVFQGGWFMCLCLLDECNTASCVIDLQQDFGPVIEDPDFLSPSYCLTYFNIYEYGWRESFTCPEDQYCCGNLASKYCCSDATDHAWPDPNSLSAINDHCFGFIDNEGWWQNGFSCPRDSDNPEEYYCCGYDNYKYCCSDPCYETSLSTDCLSEHSYCSAYTDLYGYSHDGFYCPYYVWDSPDNVYCCGGYDGENKYCCSTNVNNDVVTTVTHEDSDIDIKNTNQTSLVQDEVDVGAIVGGILGAMIILAAVVTGCICLFIDGCPLKKQFLRPNQYLAPQQPTTTSVPYNNPIYSSYPPGMVSGNVQDHGLNMVPAPVPREPPPVYSPPTKNWDGTAYQHPYYPTDYMAGNPAPVTPTAPPLE